ncbi:hypothetical protein Tco_1449975 [Tanacetum coccineum]
MTSITDQQTKLDLELVPKENRLDIGKCKKNPLKPTERLVDLRHYLSYPEHKSFGGIVPSELCRLCAIPPKIARKFKKASPTKKDNYLVPVDKEHVTKCIRIKRSINKSSTKPTTGIIIKEPPVKTKFKGKEKEKVDVAHGKGIELLSKVALTEKAQLKEVRKKSLREFHKTHPSGSGTGAKKPPSVRKITPTITSEGTGDKPGVPDVTEDDFTESESESWGNDENDSNNEQEASDEGSGQENESEEQESDSEQDEESDDDNQEEEEVDQENESEDDEIESDEDKGMDDTTDQFDDDVDTRLEEPTQTGKEVVQGEGADVEMIDTQQGNENLETTQEQVVEDAHVTISTVTKKTEVPATSSSRSSDLASKFLNFSDIPHTDAEIVSPLDVHVHHEVPRTQAPTLLTIPVSVITESSPVYTNIPQSSQTFTPPPILTTPTPPPTIETTNPLSTLPDFASVFRFNDRITALEKEVAELKKDPLHTQVTTLVDEHLDTRLGETREEFMNFLSESLMARIKEQVKDQLPQILPKEVSNFAPPPQSTYEAASTLTEFELKKILLDKMEKSKSYLTAPEHQDCYDGLKKSYALDKDFFYSYDVYSLKRGRKDKDKDEDPSAGSDRGLKKRKLSKDAEPTTGPKKKDSTSSSSKDSNLPQDQEGNLGDNEDEPRNETVSRRNWFKKPTPPQEPTDLDWNIGKTTQEGPTQNWLMALAASTSTDKSLKDFDELMSTLIDLSGYILNRGMQSRGDVYSTKRILAVTPIKVMRKHGYGYLEEIVVRRANNILYKFKEGEDVTDFTIALRMFTRSLVIHKWSRIFNLELKVIKRRSTSPSLILQNQISEKGTCTLHTKTIKDSFMSMTTRGTVLTEEKMEHIGKEKSSFHDQGHQQDAKGKEDDEEFGEIQHAEYDESNTYVLERFNTTTGNPVKKILLKLNLSDHRSILTDSKEYLKMVMERQSVKVKEIQERCIIKAFQDYQIKKGMSMSVQKSQVHEMAKFTRWRNEIMLG